MKIINSLISLASLLGIAKLKISKAVDITHQEFTV